MDDCATLLPTGGQTPRPDPWRASALRDGLRVWRCQRVIAQTLPRHARGLGAGRRADELNRAHLPDDGWGESPNGD